MSASADHTFDIKSARVDELKRGQDSTLETTEAELAEATKLTQADVTLRSLSRDRLSGLELRQG